MSKHGQPVVDLLDKRLRKKERNANKAWLTKYYVAEQVDVHVVIVCQSPVQGMPLDVCPIPPNSKTCTLARCDIVSPYRE